MVLVKVIAISEERMNRSEFEKLWFTGNVKIIVDDKKAIKSAWKGLLGKGKRRSQIYWSIIFFILAANGIWIMTKAEFELSPVVIGTSWWGVVLLALSCGIPLIMKGSAAQAAKNKIIRDPKFYSLAQDMDLFTLEEYY